MHFEVYSINFIGYIYKERKQLAPGKDNPVFPINITLKIEVACNKNYDKFVKSTKLLMPTSDNNLVFLLVLTPKFRISFSL